MKKAGDVLPFALQQLGMRKKYEEQSVMLHWREIVGEEIFSHSRAVSLSRGMLLVAVDNSVWCHHLSISREDIIRKVNVHAGEKLVTDIRFKAGYLKDYQNYEDDKAEIRLEQKLRLIRLNQQEKEEIDQKTGSIKNQALKQKINKVLKKDVAFRKLKLSEQWKECGTCSALCPPQESFCPACSLEQKQERFQKIRKIILEVPWLRFPGICDFIECTKEDYLHCKQDIQESLVSEIRNNPEVNLKLMTYIMLQQGLKPEQVTDTIVNNTLQSLRRKKYVFTPGS